MPRLKEQIGSTVSYIVLTLYALLSLYPFLWMVSSALKSNQEVLSSRSLIPSEVHFEIIIDTWNQLNFFRYFVNSVVVAVLVVAGIIIIYSMAGFGFARTKFIGSKLLFMSFLGLLFVPGVTVLVPLVQLLKALGLIGRDAGLPQTYFGLIMPIINGAGPFSIFLFRNYFACPAPLMIGTIINGAGPFSIFLFRNYFASLPSELHDAARVDGASSWGVFFRIFLPLATPIIATVGILNIIGTWSAYIWPSIVLNNPDWYTLPLKLKDLDLQIVIQWNVRMAASLIMITPIIIVFLFLQRYYIRGLTAGAIRG